MLQLHRHSECRRLLHQLWRVPEMHHWNLHISFTEYATPNCTNFNSKIVIITKFNAVIMFTLIKVRVMIS